MRSFVLMLSFVAFAAASVALMVMFVVPEVPGLFGVSPDRPVAAWQGLATIGAAIPLVFAALYFGGLLWLYLACHLFRRDELEWFLQAGPSTRLENWVLERFSRR